jgi:hypothetical protein
MHNRKWHSHSVRILCFAVASVVARQLDAQTDKPPVTATVETSLNTGSHQIRQFAFDGDGRTYFLSAQNPGTADHFTLVFDEPVLVKRMTVTTGRSDGGNTLDTGRLESSIDGKTFTDRTHFTNGDALAIHGTVPIRAIRIRSSTPLAHPLAIREIKIESEPPIDVFRYPVEKKLVRKLNALLRAGKYSDDDFERLTGQNLKQLDEEWRATLRK